MEASRKIPEPQTVPATDRLIPNRVPWWAIILFATGALLIYLILADDNYQQTFFYLQVGIATTLRITLIAFPIATVIGLLVGLGRTSKNQVFFTISTLYVEVVRGIPLVVLLLYFAFGIVPVLIELLNRLGEWGLTWASQAFMIQFFSGLADPFLIRSVPMEMRAIVALAIGYGAYEAEVFRAGIQSIDRGQVEAARSLGMNYLQTMRFIILPQAVRRVLPPLGNDFIALLKDSSLVTVLAVNELTQLARLRRSSTFRVMETFNVVAFLYLSVTLMLSAGVRALENKLKIEE
ncbi:MAG TPA: amino acid ABC transporter permease [Anaerolineales bacterium]|nr:amino acid ABC transporter permease [Anaerolineales bacterium]